MQTLFIDLTITSESSTGAIVHAEIFQGLFFMMTTVQIYGGRFIGY